MAGHLPPGVHTLVGAPRHRQRYTLNPHLGQPALELLLDGALAGLGGPPGEAGAVVLDQQLGGQRYPRLRATIRRYSTSIEKGPSPPAQRRASATISSRMAA